MNDLRFSLFGRFNAQCNDQDMEELNKCKLLELFCYLLLYRSRPHPREALVTLFWEDTPATRSKAYLRKALWQLRTVLEAQNTSTNKELILIEPEWVQINMQANFWLDVAEFEQAFDHVQGIPGRKLSSDHVQSLQNAVKLYRGELLSGWYWDWCLYERERFQHMYLIILDKLMDHCEAHGQYEEGLAYGTYILRQDQARERTHRRMMRLYYLTGDRTEALRQCERCQEILRQELGVKPAKRTLRLYEQIRTDQLFLPGIAHKAPNAPDNVNTLLNEVLVSLRQFQTDLSTTQQRVQQKIETVEMLLNGRS